MSGLVIIAGHLTLAPERRAEYLAAHEDLVRRARAYLGCLDLSLSPDPFDPARVNLVELWEGEAELEAWRKVARAPRTGIAIADGDVRKHYISRSTTPF